MKKDILMSLAKNTHGGVAPYVLGWFLGVPASILVIIFLIRGT